jgi:hypothetical protein
VVIDKVNLHQAFDLDQDLIELVQTCPNFPKQENVISRTIITTNNKSDNPLEDDAQKENYNQIKKSYMGKQKALVIQLNEDHREVSKFEKINHYYAVCKNDLDKYLILFLLKKLSLVQGKLVIYANDLIQAYRIKFFFNRFHMKAFVLSPDMAKQQLTSIMHFFQIGQFDILVALSQGYPEPLPPMKEVSNIINFEIPESYAAYKASGS